MKNLRVSKGNGAWVTWTDEEGHMIALPLIKVGKEWKTAGAYLKYGTSKSDPSFGAVFALPHDWQVPSRILRLIRKASA